MHELLIKIEYNNMHGERIKIFTNIELNFLFCTIQDLSYSVYCAKILNFNNNSFLSTRKDGSTQCENMVNTFKTN